MDAPNPPAGRPPPIRTSDTIRIVRRQGKERLAAWLNVGPPGWRPRDVESFLRQSGAVESKVRVTRWEKRHSFLPSDQPTAYYRFQAKTPTSLWSGDAIGTRTGIDSVTVSDLLREGDRTYLCKVKVDRVGHRVIQSKQEIQLPDK